MDISIYNISELIVEHEAGNWDLSLKAVLITGVSVSILGLVGNCFSFLSTDSMEKSNFTEFIKCLAVWDSLSAIFSDMGLRLAGLNPTAKVHYSSFWSQIRQSSKILKIFDNLEDRIFENVEKDKGSCSRSSKILKHLQVSRGDCETPTDIK